MSYLKTEPFKGSLLAAEPYLGDPNFERSVILLTEHEESGSVGFVINKPLEVQLDEITRNFPSIDTPVYHGGPVQQDSLFFIHNKGEILPGSNKIVKDLYWGGELEALKDFIENGIIGPDDIRFFLGYSGWDKEQLETELEEKSWIVLDPKAIDILHDSTEEMWKKIFLVAGGDYSLWADSPKDPSLN